MSALDRLTINALLDNDQRTLSRLPGIVQIALGKVCPNCGGTDVQWTMRQEDDAFCETCEEWYSVTEKTTEAYDDVRWDYLDRKASSRRRK